MTSLHRILAACVLTLAALLAPLSAAMLAHPRAPARPASPTIGGCPVFPSDNVWNADISALPVDARSASYIASIGGGGHLHPDFGSGLYDGGPIGIPYVVAPSSQTAVPVSFNYADESDPGPYPIPSNAPIEGGAQSDGDRHVLVVQSGTCKLYEMFASYPQGSGWRAGSGAVWNLRSNALRPRGWTSADAAGLPILPGLVRYDEVAAGAINHAIRFTVSRTQRAFIWPARHLASSVTDLSAPPMGLRLRLRANVDISRFSPANRIILTALKRYGMIVADNGSNWFLSGAPDDRWSNDDLHALGAIPGSDFEVVNTSMLMVNQDSGQAHTQSGAPTATTAATASATASATPGTPTLTAQDAHKQDQNTHATTNWPLMLAVMALVAVGLIGGGIWLRARRRILSPFR
ncbi:MAG TPA: hypothetical protein VH349_19515 [Ktedonobacterales bacterium]